MDPRRAPNPHPNKAAYHNSRRGIQPGCGNIGRSKSAHRSSLSSLHRDKRNKQDCVLPDNGLPGGWGNSRVMSGYSRPGSAKVWVEKRWQRQEQQELKKQQWEEDEKRMKTAQFRADFFNARPSGPRCYTAAESPRTHPEEDDVDHQKSPTVQKIEGAAGCSKQFNLDDNSEQIYNGGINSGRTDGKRYEANKHEAEESQLPHKSYRTLLGPTEMMRPEITALKQKLEDLKSKNAEERRKLNEELNYRAWKSNSNDARKIEADRLNEFVRSAWVDQRQWKADEQKRRALEDARIEEEAARMRLMEEERERRDMNLVQKKKEQYQRDLQEQLSLIKEQEKHRKELLELENWLAAEHHRVCALEDMRKMQLESRKAKALAVTWSKQHQIKLRQRAAQVIEDILDDQMVMKELLKSQRCPSVLRGGVLPFNDEEEHKWVLSVLAEHKRLEELRQEEYDLLFSEEAAKLWQRRDQQWEQEERAREALLSEVLEGRRKQLQMKLQEKNQRETMLDDERKEAEIRMADAEEKLRDLERKQELPDDNPSSASDVHDGPYRGDGLDCLEEREALHRKEIARLEAEMAKLWGPLYKPPYYGRKKIQW